MSKYERYDIVPYDPELDNVVDGEWEYESVDPGSPEAWQAFWDCQERGRLVEQATADEIERRNQHANEYMDYSLAGGTEELKQGPGLLSALAGLLRGMLASRPSPMDEVHYSRQHHRPDVGQHQTGRRVLSAADQQLRIAQQDRSQMRLPAPQEERAFFQRRIKKNHE